MHVHAAALCLSLHSAFAPHGDGLQGSNLSVEILGGTKIDKYKKMIYEAKSGEELTCSNQLTSNKSIAIVTRVTFAQRNVICDITSGMTTTNAWTWIFTFLSDAS